MRIDPFATGPNQGCIPLDATAAVDDLAGQIRALPQVACVEATTQNGAPESNWGNRFFFVGAERMRPFATIVLRDMPGFDEDSNLDRPDMFRLNLDLGREEFERQFGYPPRKFTDHRSGIDFSEVDQLMPHPIYGTQAWACILNPSPGRPDTDRLIRLSHQRALRRAHRRQQRT
jgi:hypothetical protein